MDDGSAITVVANSAAAANTIRSIICVPPCETLVYPGGLFFSKKSMVA